MSTAQVIVLDHVVALLSAGAWIGAGATAAARRTRLAFGLLVAAVTATLARGVTVAVLAGQGWWFAQEKVLLGLPMLGAAGLAAVVVAGPPLLAAWRGDQPWTGPVPGVVLLLTAGYAAVAGLVVTLVAGYPMSWSTALITLAVVGGAAVLTARAVGPGAPVEAGGFARRRFLGLVAGAAVTGVGLRFLPAARTTDPAQAGPSVADLRGPREPAPGGATRRYTVTARTATVRLPTGREIDAWTFDGRLPGPPITATAGDLIEVTLRNADIRDGVTLHWHGYDVPCGEDGAPGATQAAVAPGDEFVYRFRAEQVGTYWYHTHQASHRGVRRGLYGTLVVTPHPAAAAGHDLDLTLPVHTFDGTVVLADHDGRTERVAPAGTAVRLRIVNTDSTAHRITLAGTAFRVSAVDGRDLNRPGEVSRTAVRLPAGGRADLVFAMPAGPVALLVDDEPAGGLLLRPDAGTRAAVPDTSGWPELDLLRYGVPAARPFDAGNADRHFTLVLDRGLAMVDGSPAYAQTVNGRGHPSVPDLIVAEGDLVRFTVVNRSLETHPWHLHGHPVLVVSRNGVPASGSPLWMDTFDVRPGEVWQVAFRATNPGIWMNHCHNLPHAKQGMMLRLRYEGVTSPFHGGHAAG